MPKVSVVLPVFNAADTVARAVRSILEQTLCEIELIVVDDGSTDDTADVVKAIRDPRLRLVQQPRGQVAVAANTGTAHATAPLIARMDADDYSHPQRLERQWEMLQQQSADVVGCQVRIVDEAGGATCTMQNYQRWINEETHTAEQIRALRFVEFPLVNPTIMARREYFELGFSDGDFPEDYDLMLRASRQGMRFAKVDQILLDWTDGPNRLTRSDPRYTPEAFDRCRRTHLLDGPLAGAKAVDLWGIGQTGKSWLRWLQAQGLTVRRGYEVNRRKIDTKIHGVPIAHPDDMPNADGTPLIIAVGADGARATITPHVQSRQYQIGGDAWFVA
jgi:glycosyltransferase involved in cell wall biosynthesis